MSMRNISATAKWLVDKKLLNEEEATQFATARQLPSDFPGRVLGSSGGAVPVSASDGVRSQCVVKVDAFKPPEPPVLTYDGPLPRPFQFEAIPEYEVMLHEVGRGRMFVGFDRSTLILDRNRFHLDISSPASNWISPAFAEAPVDLALKGTVAVLFTNGATLFGHWMFDLLPKFDVLRRGGWTDRNIDYYVVNSTQAAFSNESLARIGVPPGKVIRASGCLVSGDTLLVPSRVRRRFCTPDWVRRFVASLFLPGGEDDQEAPRRERIYISRANARRRRVLNEPEVRALLESRGFHTVFAERMTIAELAGIVHRAGWIVTPHGAGITNVAFARAGVHVLEMFGAHIVSEGWLMTKAAGGQHYVLAGRDDKGRYFHDDAQWQTAAKNLKNETDYTVAADDLCRAIDIIDAKQAAAGL